MQQMKMLNSYRLQKVSDVTTDSIAIEVTDQDFQTILGLWRGQDGMLNVEFHPSCVEYGVSIELLQRMLTEAKTRLLAEE